jgi:hypothetical protein
MIITFLTGDALGAHEPGGGRRQRQRRAARLRKAVRGEMPAPLLYRRYLLLRARKHAPEISGEVVHFGIPLGRRGGRPRVQLRRGSAT